MTSRGSGLRHFDYQQTSTASEGTGLIFDNVCLVAADTNNKDHAFWVDRIRARNRIYIAINEDDKALAVSRMKSRDDQLARLGHYPYRLDSRSAVYVNFTDEKAVSKNSHAYFEGSTIRDNPKVKRFFKDAFNGKGAEDRLAYEPATNMHLI